MAAPGDFFTLGEKRPAARSRRIDAGKMIKNDSQQTIEE